MASLDANDYEIGGYWSVVHIDAMGRRASVSPNPIASIDGKAQDSVTKLQNLEWSAYAHIVPTAPVLFDFDGDGIAEAVVVIQYDVIDESGTDHTSSGRVWTARGDAITLFKPAGDIVVEEARDVDGDGRPDLITHERYEGVAYINCGSQDGYSVFGPLLLMHSLADGTFSRDDAAALAFAKRECPNLLRPVIVPAEGFEDKVMVDIRKSAKNIACARLRGADKQSLLSEIETQCYRLNENCVTCDSKELLQRWATIDPPLRIR
jgi:hypothetical protein